MDFFEQQEVSKRKSYLLIFLFLLSICILILASNITVFIFYSFFNSDTALNFYKYATFKTFIIITIPLVLSILILTYMKFKEFEDVTSVLHDYFNAKLIKKYKSSDKEKILLNIVEEISIASGIPPLSVYTIEDNAINSFVIGHNYDDTSIIVTTLALEKLSRDELQAMIAHDFAKISTNDMALNIKITAFTYSLLSLSLIGQSLYSGVGASYRDSEKNDHDAIFFSIILWFVMIILGTALVVLGSLGYLLASLIKFFIIRERMYLNDAITIEFIRNPVAFIRVLKISLTHNSSLYSYDLFEHTYFVARENHILHSLFNLYPDVQNRINKLNLNDTDDLYIKKEEEITEKKVKSKKDEVKEKLFNKENIVQTVTGIAMVDVFSNVQSYAKRISKEKDSLPDFINEMLNDLESTKALIICILLSKDLIHKEEQINLIEETSLRKKVLEKEEEVNKLEGKYNLMIFFYSLNILKQLDLNSYRKYRNLLNKLIYLDDVLDIFEWNIENILIRQLDIHYSLRTVKKEKYFSYESLQYSLEIFLSVISNSQESEKMKASSCFEMAVDIGNMNSLNFIHKKDLSNKLLKEAIKDLEFCSLKLRKKILETTILCICVDNIVENWEIELIYSVSILLSIPLPLFKKETFCNLNEINL